MLTNEKQQYDYNERAMLLQLLMRLQVKNPKYYDKIKWILRKKKKKRGDKKQVNKNMSPTSMII